MNLQLKLTNKLRRSIAENDNPNLYGWITSIVGEDDMYVDKQDKLQDNEIIMISLPIVTDVDKFNGTENTNDEFSRGMIVCCDENILQISNVETGILYCFNKSKDFILTPKQLLSFKYVTIPCALAIRQETISVSMVLLKKYANSMTNISYVPDYALNIKGNSYYNTIINRGNSKMLDFIPTGICIISHINSTAEFYIQLENDILKLRDINEDLKRNENNFVTMEVKTGKICVVMNPINNKWHRAQVISSDEKGIRVKLIDIGNNIVVKQVYSSTNSKMLQRPPIAQKCCLKMSPALGKFSTIAENNFKAMTHIKGGGLLNVSMLKLGSLNMVELLHNNYSIADKLISSQIKKDLNLSDTHMTVNSYSYRASMDDDELADLKEYNY